MSHKKHFGGFVPWRLGGEKPGSAAAVISSVIPGYASSKPFLNATSKFPARRTGALDHSLAFGSLDNGFPIGRRFALSESRCSKECKNQKSAQLTGHRFIHSGFLTATLYATPSQEAMFSAQIAHVQRWLFELFKICKSHDIRRCTTILLAVPFHCQGFRWQRFSRARLL